MSKQSYDPDNEPTHTRPKAWKYVKKAFGPANDVQKALMLIEGLAMEDGGGVRLHFLLALHHYGTMSEEARKNTHDAWLVWKREQREGGQTKEAGDPPEPKERPVMNSDEYLTMQQAAEIAPGSPKKETIGRWCRDGLKSRSGQMVYLKHMRAGGKLLILKDDLDKFLVDLSAAPPGQPSIKTPEYLTLEQVGNVSPGTPSKLTLWRWCRKGVKSRGGQTVYLEHIRAAGRLLVLKESLDQFFTDLNAGDLAHFEKIGTPIERRPRAAARERDIAEANRQLTAAGI